jgi:hypothetical protein
MSWRKLLARSRKQGSALPQEQEPHNRDTGEDRLDCTCHSADLAKIAEVASDEKEVVLVRLLREAFSGFCTGSVQYWNAGFHSAGELMGEDEGTILFAHILALTRAIKSDRLETFYFQPTGCLHITDDEMLTLAMVQAVRRNNPPLLSSLADRMAQGGTPLRIYHTALRLGSFIEAMGEWPRHNLHSPMEQSLPTLH